MRGPSTNRTPSLRRHKPSARAVVTLNGHDHYLGPWPANRKKPAPEVQRAYDLLIAEWLANGRGGRLLPDEVEGELSIEELILAFWQHAQEHYRHEDGTPTNELNDYKLSLKPLRELYGTQRVADFGPLKLKAVRERMVEAKLSRGVVNQRIGRIVRMFKWGVGEELVPETIHRALATVRGLEKGRTRARETEPVKPVAVAVVEATLPFVLVPVRAMARLQLLTGMRPGEACAMRACDLDTTGDVWLYRPAHHKTKHKGKDRIVALGPKAQEIVRPFLALDTQAYLFSPQDGMERRRAELRSKRQTKVQPSQASRKRRKPKTRPGNRYRNHAYALAIARGVKAAHKAQACADCRHREPDERCADCLARAIPHWHPHQLRHTHATEVRRRFGLEAAQVALGHAQAKVTEVYAERDVTLAAKVAREIG